MQDEARVSVGAANLILLQHPLSPSHFNFFNSNDTDSLRNNKKSY